MSTHIYLSTYADDAIDIHPSISAVSGYIGAHAIYTAIHTQVHISDSAYTILTSAYRLYRARRVYTPIYIVMAPLSPHIRYTGAYELHAPSTTPRRAYIYPVYPHMTPPLVRGTYIRCTHTGRATHLLHIGRTHEDIHTSIPTSRRYTHAHTRALWGHISAGHTPHTWIGMWIGIDTAAYAPIPLHPCHSGIPVHSTSDRHAYMCVCLLSTGIYPWDHAYESAGQAPYIGRYVCMCIRAIQGAMRAKKRRYKHSHRCVG